MSFSFLHPGQLAALFLGSQLLLGGSALSADQTSTPARTEVPSNPGQVTILKFTERTSPLDLSVRCADYLDRNKDPKPPKPPPRPKHVPPDPSGMAVIDLGERSSSVIELPGSRPEDLPIQALEGSPEVLRRIRSVMNRAKQGLATRLSFFGASHTGADLWTGRIRRLLQDRHGDLGHGFILPAALYRGYRGADVNLCRTEGWLADWVGKKNGHGDGLLGPAGMSVSSANPGDFGWVETTRQNPHGRKVSKFIVMALNQPAGGHLELRVDNGKVQRVSTRADSHELHTIEIQVVDGPHRLELRPAGDGEVRLFGVSMEREGSGILVDAMGIRGRTMKTWLKWDKQLAAAGLKALDPALVVIAYGTNEASHQDYSMKDYRDDLEAALGELRARLPMEVPCILAGPSDRGVRLSADRYAVWNRTAMVAQVQRELADSYGCAFWDWQQATGGPGSMVAWYFHQPAMAAKDLIHFNRRGYQWLGDRFVAALDALEHDPRLD